MLFRSVGWQWLRAESNLQRATRNFELLDRAADEMLVVVEEWVTRTPPRTEAQQQRLSSSLRLFEAFLNEEPANRAARRRLAETHARVAEIRRLLRQLDRAAAMILLVVNADDAGLDRATDDAILRWNTCARMIMSDPRIAPMPEGRVEAMME